MATIENVVANLQNVGIFQFFLPFILIFAVVYGMLTKLKIFGNPKDDPGANKINAIVAFAFAAFIMVYPTTSLAVMDMTQFLANMAAGTLIYIVTIIAFLVVMFMVATSLGGGKAPEFGKAGIIGAAVAIVLVIALFLSSGGTQVFPGLNLNLGVGFSGFGGGFAGIDPSVVAIVLVLLVLILAIWWVIK
jgi:hypothetical protein